MPVVRGIDSDNYDGPVPASHYKRLYDEYGVRFNILGLEAQMPFVESQKQASREAGLDVPFGYKFLYWAPTDIENMKKACAAQLPIAIDCEWKTNWDSGRVMQRIYEARDTLQHEGLYWGIYTSKGWWVEKTADDGTLNVDKLWHASWPYGAGHLPPLDFLPQTIPEGTDHQHFDLRAIEGVGPYMGRYLACVWQYADTCYGDELGDWDFDMNAMWVPDDVPPPQPEPTPPPPANYVTGARLYFKDGTEWNLEVLPPPEFR